MDYVLLKCREINLDLRSQNSQNRLRCHPLLRNVVQPLPWPWLLVPSSAEGPKYNGLNFDGLFVFLSGHLPNKTKSHKTKAAEKNDKESIAILMDLRVPLKLVKAESILARWPVIDVAKAWPFLISSSVLPRVDAYIASSLFLASSMDAFLAFNSALNPASKVADLWMGMHHSGTKDTTMQDFPWQPNRKISTLAPIKKQNLVVGNPRLPSHQLNDLAAAAADLVLHLLGQRNNLFGFFCRGPRQRRVS